MELNKEIYLNNANTSTANASYNSNNLTSLTNKKLPKNSKSERNLNKQETGRKIIPLNTTQKIHN